MNFNIIPFLDFTRGPPRSTFLFDAVFEQRLVVISRYEKCTLVASANRRPWGAKNSRQPPISPDMKTMDERAAEAESGGGHLHMIRNIIICKYYLAESPYRSTAMK
jgi:hypothetical protein